MGRAIARQQGVEKTMGKVRVYELARELGMEDSKPLMRILRDMGYKVKTASSGLSPDAVRKIREVVAPHIEQARRDAEQKQKAEEAAKTKSKDAPKVKVRRAIRIVNRASDVQKKALMERQARIAAGETPVRTAAEVMEVADEKRRAEEAARLEAEAAKAAEDAAAQQQREAASRIPSGDQAQPHPRRLLRRSARARVCRNPRK